MHWLCIFLLLRTIWFDDGLKKYHLQSTVLQKIKYNHYIQFLEFSHALSLPYCQLLKHPFFSNIHVNRQYLNNDSKKPLNKIQLFSKEMKFPALFQTVYFLLIFKQIFVTWQPNFKSLSIVMPVIWHNLFPIFCHVLFFIRYTFS